MIYRFIRIIVAIFLCFSGGFGQGKNLESASLINVEPQEKWRTVFGGQEYLYHFQVSSSEHIEGSAGWSLRYENKIIMRGESEFETNPDKMSIFGIRFKTPPINEGIVMPVQFSVTLYRIGKKEKLASWEETLHIFSNDPFVFKKEWLKGLKIGLFSPGKKTSEVFKELGIPFSSQGNIDALPEFDGSLLVIGSGLDFGEYRGLWDTILEVSSRQIPVLVLAPTGGAISVPGAEKDTLPQPAGIRFQRRDIICELDKRLDVEAWASDSKVVVSSMLLKTVREKIIGEFISSEKGWPWFEIDFAGKGKIVVCGFGITESINDGPTPRYLLARLIEYLTGNRKLTGKGE